MQEMVRPGPWLAADAEATPVNRIDTPTVVSINHHAVRQDALAYVFERFQAMTARA